MWMLSFRQATNYVSNVALANDIALGLGSFQWEMTVSHLTTLNS